MPRPLTDDPRDCFTSFRFTQAEITRLRARARASGQTLSAYVRGLVLAAGQGEAARSQAEPHSRPNPASWPAAEIGGPSRPMLDAPVRPRDRLAAHLLSEQMRRVGVNLNQIARRMNEQQIPPPPELTMVLDDIRTYVRQAREL